MTVKIKWEFTTGRDLRAIAPDSDSDQIWSFLRDADFEPIQKWCEETGIGKRMSWDTFRFKTKADITTFLLRWS